PDGRTVAAARALGGIELLDRGTGKVLKTLPAGGARVKALAFSPDGLTLAAGYGPVPKRSKPGRWAGPGGEGGPAPEGGSGQNAALAFSPDGKFLAAAGSGGTVKVWANRTGQEVLAAEGEGEVPCLAFSPDSKRLAWARGDAVTVRELPGGKEVRVI